MVESKVNVFVDGGSSVRKEDELARELDIDIVPLDIKFYENGQWVSYPDSDISPEDFYQRMKQSTKLPQTSGAISGRLAERYQKLPQDSSAVSIHITSKHSVSWESGILARQLTQEVRPDLTIEVIDSKTVSLGAWFLAEHAAVLASQGFTAEEIKSEVLSQVPNIDVFAMVASLDNLVKGGRVSGLMGFVGNLIHMNPIMGFEDGKIISLAKPRTVSKAKKELVARVENSTGDIAKLAIIHTNGLENALELKEMLSPVYQGEIIIQEAGPVFGVHLGDGGVGIALLKH